MWWGMNMVWVFVISVFDFKLIFLSRNIQHTLKLSLFSVPSLESGTPNLFSLFSIQLNTWIEDKYLAISSSDAAQNNLLWLSCVQLLYICNMFSLVIMTRTCKKRSLWGSFFHLHHRSRKHWRWSSKVLKQIS